MPIIFWGFLGMCGLALVFFLRRNQRVFAFEIEMLNRVAVLAQRDILYGRNCVWRHEQLETVSYDDMMKRFWKPLTPESWWSDRSFLDFEEPTDDEHAHFTLMHRFVNEHPGSAPRLEQTFKAEIERLTPTIH